MESKMILVLRRTLWKMATKAGSAGASTGELNDLLTLSLNSMGPGIRIVLIFLDMGRRSVLGCMQVRRVSGHFREEKSLFILFHIEYIFLDIFN